MKSKLIYEGMPDLLPMQGRSEGMHVSVLINSLCVALGHYEKRDEEKGPSQMSKNMMGLGNALEHAIVHRFALDQPNRYLQIGELEKDNLFGTPDLVDQEDWADVEIKLTWMSSKHGPGSMKFWKYETQLKAYCWMLETVLGRLHVCHVNGDYNYDAGEGCAYRTYEYEFTQGELEGNWDMLLRQWADYHGGPSRSRKGRGRV